MTFLELVNEVLVKMREEPVSSVSTSTYAKTIAILVNQAKRAVEDAAQWTALLETISVTTTAGTADYTLTGTGERTTVYEVIDSTNLGKLKRYGARDLIRAKQLETGNGTPDRWGIIGMTSGGELTLRLYPTPEGAVTYSVNTVNPVANLVNNSDAISVPAEPVVQHAYAYAIKERGEDMGMRFDEALDQYRRTLSRYLILNGMTSKGVQQWQVV